MGYLIKPKISIIEHNNEIQIVIDLNLNVNLNSTNVTIDNSDVQQNKILEEKPKEEENNNWEIPEFTSGEKVNFGKKG